ncbi:MAG: CoA pyrophosphatase [Actinomycetota bacterium]
MAGPLSPPLGEPVDHDADLRARLASNLAAHDRLEVDEPELRHAAVAITVVAGENGAGFVLTRRSSGLRAHSHQYALPGGRLDPGETPPDAARRELEEEVGVTTAHHEVLGALDDYRTRSGYVITPVVVWPETTVEFTAQPTEVDQIFVIGLDELDRPDSPRWIPIEESEHPVLQLPLRNRLIHAPTGALLWQFREVAMHGRTVRLDTVEEPVWAWS